MDLTTSPFSFWAALLIDILWTVSQSKKRELFFFKKKETHTQRKGMEKKSGKEDLKKNKPKMQTLS